MLVLESENILLRDYVADDLDAVHAWMSDPETMKYLGEGHTDSREETLVRFARSVGYQLEKERQSWNLALVRKDTDAVIGEIDLWYRHRNWGGGEGGLGLFVRRDHWGRGLATEGARRIVEFGFAELGMDRISASCIKGNGGSERVMRKLGMQQEAEYRQSSRRFGDSVNRLGFAVLRAEWDGKAS